MAGIFLVIFSLGIGAAMLTDHWQTHIPAGQYLSFAAQHRTAQTFNPETAPSKVDAVGMKATGTTCRSCNRAGLYEANR